MILFASLFSVIVQENPHRVLNQSDSEPISSFPLVFSSILAVHYIDGLFYYSTEKAGIWRYY